MTMRKTMLGVVAAALVSGGVFGTSRLWADDKPATTQPVAKATNKTCPVSGDPIDPAITTTYDGKSYAFCCADCIKSFQKDPAKYAAKAK